MATQSVTHGDREQLNSPVNALEALKEPADPVLCRFKAAHDSVVDSRTLDAGTGVTARKPMLAICAPPTRLAICYENGNSSGSTFRQLLNRQLTALWGFILWACHEPYLFARLLLNTFIHLSNIECLSPLGRIRYLPLQHLLERIDLRLTSEVALEAEGTRKRMIRDAGYLIVMIAAIQYWFADKGLYYSLMFMPTRSHVNCFALVYYINLTDFTVKCATILIKMLVTALPSHVLEYSKRSKIYYFIEMTSQMYRLLLPTPSWFLHFTTAYSTWPMIFQLLGYLIAILYVICKSCVALRKRVLNWWEAYGMLFGSNKHTSSSSLSVANIIGDDNYRKEHDCAICYNGYVNPTVLKCKHMFCEKCITKWFIYQRRVQNTTVKNSCPLCFMEIIVDEKMWYKCGATSGEFMHI